jgi:hypothetical protein
MLRSSVSVTACALIGVFALGGEIDELAGKGEAHDLALAVGEGLVEPQQSPAHPVDVGRAIPLVEDVGILGEEAPMAMQRAAGRAACGCTLRVVTAPPMLANAGRE